MTAPDATDDERFKQLLLYLARASEGDPAFGATKLNKLLFFCDFLAYRSLGRSITGQTYMRLERGPVPRHLLPVRDRLVEEHRCAVQNREYFGRRQERLVALEEPDPRVFTPEEIQLIDSVLEELRQSSASKISELSHLFVGWQAAELREDIPYETVFVGAPRAPTKEETDYGQMLARELGEETPSDH